MKRINKMSAFDQCLVANLAAYGLSALSALALSKETPANKFKAAAFVAAVGAAGGMAAKAIHTAIETRRFNKTVKDDLKRIVLESTPFYNGEDDPEPESSWHKWCREHGWEKV